MENPVVFENRKNSFISFINLSFQAASTAHNILFEYLDEEQNEDFDERQNEIIAALFLSKALSLMSAAKAIYYSNVELLEKPEIEGIFGAFDAFESEFLTNVKENHSHQWTDIKFNTLKEAVEDFVTMS